MERNIYLVLSRTGTLLNRAIIHFGHMEYGHVSLSLDPTLTQMYSFGRVYPRFPLWGGFVMENIHDGIYTLFQNSECLILQITISEDKYEKIVEELKKFQDIGKSYRYNFIGVLGIKMGIAVNRSKAYFCSQFVSLVLSRIGIWEKNPALTTPEDLMGIAGCKVIYEGRAGGYSA